MKPKLLFNTVRHLRREQIVFQLRNKLIKPRAFSYYYPKGQIKHNSFLNFTGPVQTVHIATKDGTFTFLNRSVEFGHEIDWGFMRFGKLWNYNLHYVYFVLQNDIEIATRTNWIKSLYRSLLLGDIRNEPYPASLRIMNLIRFLSSNKISDEELLSGLYADAAFLAENLEFHLLGNHLLENAYALLMAAAFFENKYWWNKGLKILYRELREQILADGGHFELSPMYHKIILFRNLELLDWYRFSQSYQNDLGLYAFVAHKAAAMLGWLKNMTFSNGDTPHFSDSADGIAYTSSDLFSYGRNLGLDNTCIPLNVSGYRKFTASGYECIVDVGPIGAPYQPGHGHADALSFIMYGHGDPLFLEAGTSTYESGLRRELERSTFAHNTASLAGVSQSEVWDTFRVGRRANVTIISETPNSIQAKHSGYSKYGIVHERVFQFAEREVEIIDRCSGDDMTVLSCMFHLAPDICPNIRSAGIIVLSNYVTMTFQGAKEVSIEDYQLAQGFNITVPAKAIRVSWSTQLTTNIIFKKETREP
jgi:uncharacterized heparinase superfamily protein